MKAEYEITIDDALEFQRHLMNHAPNHVKQRSRMLKMFPLWFIFVGVSGWFLKWFSLEMVVVFFVLAGLCPLMYFLGRKQIMKQAHIIFRRDEKFLGRKSIELTENAILLKGDGLTAELAWNKFNKYEENPNYLFLYLTPQNAIVLPKYKMNPANEVKLLIDFIKSKVSLHNAASKVQVV